jgi:ribosome-binding factor A
VIDHPRARRLADRIQVIVAETLERKLKDPRLGFVTITDVRVTGDLQQATVFYTVLGDSVAHAASEAALASATGVVRAEVGRQTGLRLTPSVTFVADAVPETADHMESLLRDAATADESVRRVAAGATYAGDPDPYRRSEDEPLSDEPPVSLP